MLRDTMHTCARDNVALLELEESVKEKDPSVAVAAENLANSIGASHPSAFDSDYVGQIREIIHEYLAKLSAQHAPSRLFDNCKVINEILDRFRPDGTVDGRIVTSPYLLWLHENVDNMYWVHQHTAHFCLDRNKASLQCRRQVTEAAMNVRIAGRQISGLQEFRVAIRSVNPALLERAFPSPRFLRTVDSLAGEATQAVPEALLRYAFVLPDRTLMRGPLPNSANFGWLYMRGVRTIAVVGHQTGAVHQVIMQQLRQEVRDSGMSFQFLPVNQSSGQAENIETLDRSVDDFARLLRVTAAQGYVSYVCSADSEELTAVLLSSWKASMGAYPVRACRDEPLRRSTRALVREYYNVVLERQA